MGQFKTALGETGGWVVAHPILALSLCALVGLLTTLTAARKE